jgi:hypothetical protein
MISLLIASTLNSLLKYCFFVITIFPLHFFISHHSERTNVMNPLPKTPPLFASGMILLLSFFITFFYLSSAAAAEKNAATSTISTLKETEQKARISLTKEEREWLSANPHIRLATLTNQPPFSMMDADRNHTGMLADILALISDAIGQRIETKLVENVVSDITASARKTSGG